MGKKNNVAYANPCMYSSRLIKSLYDQKVRFLFTYFRHVETDQTMPISRLIGVFDKQKYHIVDFVSVLLINV